MEFERGGKPYTLIDTAGLRKRGKVFEAIEKFSVVKTLQSIADANVVGVLPVSCESGRVTSLGMVSPESICDSGENACIGAAIIGIFHDTEVRDRVADRLASGEFDNGRPPARLHGDLWAGNIIWTREGPVLIDPAAHGGHAETDLAMLLLFTAPHIARIIAAYDEAAPLADGWQERVGLHQLFPVMVHAVVFGGDYVRQSVEMARAYA